MRYAVLADVHGNIHALKASMAAAEREDVSEFLVLGDLVGYGAHPNECVEMVASLGATVIAGNHDLMAIGKLSDERCIQLARDSLAWTRRVLAPSARAYLESLPLMATAPYGTVLAHGTLDDPQSYTASPGQAATQIDQLGRIDERAELLLLGHTHRPLAYSRDRGLLRASAVDLQQGDLALLNPGAVGQSREPRAYARLLILDWDVRSARFLRIKYDIDSARSALEAIGLSPRGVHLRPGPRGVARYVRNRVGRR